MIVKLFIVAHSPFLTDTAHHRLCLVVRRKGPISESGLPVPIGETEVPIIARSPDIFDYRRDPIIDVLIPETRRCLSPAVSKFISKQLAHGGLALFKNDRDTDDKTTWYGVRIDEIFDLALLDARYGCLDAFTHDELTHQKKIAAKSSKTIPLGKLRKSNNLMIRKMAERSPNLMVMSATIHHNHLRNEDLYMGEKILSSFQKQEDARIAKLSQVRYVVRSAAL